MTKKDLADMVEAEEKRLGLHSPEFMQRHREIMETADRMRRENKKQEISGDHDIGNITTVCTDTHK